MQRSCSLFAKIWNSSIWYSHDLEFPPWKILKENRLLDFILELFLIVTCSPSFQTNTCKQSKNGISQLGMFSCVRLPFFLAVGKVSSQKLHIRSVPIGKLNSPRPPVAVYGTRETVMCLNLHCFLCTPSSLLCDRMLKADGSAQLFGPSLLLFPHSSPSSFRIQCSPTTKLLSLGLLGGMYVRI